MGDFVTEFVLMPNRTCEIEANMTELRHISDASNLVIKLANTTTWCEKAVVRLEAPIIFDNATSVSFVNVKFMTAHSNVKPNKTFSPYKSSADSDDDAERRIYLLFKDSRFVILEQCEFVVPALYQAVVIRNTQPVLICACKIYGFDSQLRVKSLDKLVAAVDVYYNQVARDIDPCFSAASFGVDRRVEGVSGIQRQPKRSFGARMPVLQARGTYRDVS